MNHESMLETLRSADVVPSVSGSVAQQLLSMLLGDHMAAGDRLPPERKLSEALGVGRSAVREALAALEVLGIVVTRAGSGTYLRASSSELLPQTLSWSLLLDQDQMEELAFVRSALELAAAERAAQVVTPQDAERLRALIQAQRDHIGKRAYVDADVAFHQHIAAMAKNPILDDLLSTARSLLRVWFEHAVDREEDMQQAIREHIAVADAIIAGDAAAAGLAMRRHMETATERILRSARTR
ncbi:FCD domain-containing protein [Agrococcus sp. 1P02AA]|uniref:FadR/GntR family transcriptional regulator n=1 Tax=Agrococcus sp. 1P02AA TaxID=3132259 RepID=UPI0039A6EAC0